MNLGARKSREDWPADVTAPKGAPNILLILVDDVGFSATHTFGGAIATPTFDRLAQQGLRYNGFHVNAICAPSRASLLSGRTDHQIGFGTITEFAAGYPGYNSLWPKSSASVAEVLKDNGYHTAAFGKWHGTPVWQATPAGPFDRWQSCSPATKPVRRHVGGPMPLFGGKAFFFASYEGLRVRTPTPVTPGSLTVPTALERTGDFSQSPKKPTLPATTVDGNGNTVAVQCGTAAAPKICPDALDPVAQNLLSFVPAGSSDPAAYGHPTQQSADANIDNGEGLIRVNYRLGDKHQISGMYYESRGTSNTPTVSSNQIVSYAGMQNYAGQYNVALSDIWSVAANKVNTIRTFYSLNHYIIGDIYGDQHMLSDLGSKAAQGGNYNAQPMFKVTGYWQMGTNNAGPNNPHSFTLGASDNFNWTLGRHDVKFGGAYMWDRFTSTGGGSSDGLFTLSARNASENAFVNFLLGQATTLMQNNGVFFRSHSQDPSLYIQDNWKILRRLTLNLGMRWEYFPMYTGQNDTATFVPGQQSTRFPGAPPGLVFSGDRGIPDGIQHTPWNTLAPRFGFAYDIFGNGRTSLRGAYGILYAAIDQVAVSNNLVQQPFSRSVTVSNTPNLVNPFAPGADPFPYSPSTGNAVFLFGANLFALQPGYDNIPSAQEYSLGIQ